MRGILLFLLVTGLMRPVAAQIDIDTRVENQSEIAPGENVDEKIKKNFFLKAEATKTECYVGECIMATFKAYSRLDANSNVVSRPSLTGFSVIEMVDAYNTLPETEKYNGIYYNTHLIRKVQLFPLEPGRFELEPAEVESIIQFVKTEKNEKRKFKDLFRPQIQRGSVIHKELTLKTPSINITVKPLPEKEQPENFTGAVGTFSVQIQMENSKPAQYQPAVVKLIISGTGNLPLITDPEINWPVKPEVLTPQVTEEVNKYNFPLSGIKIFEYTIPTRDTGTFTIPPVKFSYFNPAEKKYKTDSTKPYTYTVVPAENRLTEIDEPIQTGKETPLPLHYIYFGVVVAAILGVIVYQLKRAAKK